MDLKSCILEVTQDLVAKGVVFNTESRAKFEKIYACFIQNKLESTPNARMKSGDVPVVVGRHAVAKYVGATSSPQCTKSTANPKSTTETDLPVLDWTNSVLKDKNYCCIQQNGLRVCASRDIRQHEILIVLQGNVLPSMSGYKLYQRYGLNYSGTIIFNLGMDFDFNWFCTKDFAHTLQSEIKQHGLPSNCEVFILNEKSKAVPIIFATRDIKKYEYICLSKQMLSQTNESFLSWNNSKTENFRRSSRVPNRSKRFEAMYESHLLAGTTEGLEKRSINEHNDHGVFVNREFGKGEFLVEYIGEVITEEVAKKRFDSMPADLGSNIFFLGSGFQNYCIDATHAESLGKLVNHSKRKANCKMLCRILDHKPRIFLVATKNIEENTQLFYDFNDKNPNFLYLRE